MVSDPNFEEDISVEVQPYYDNLYQQQHEETKVKEYSKPVSRNLIENKLQSMSQQSTTSLNASALVGNVAKLKNSKLY